jgi:AhpD family alkylhydroperoxidase
VSQEVKEFFEKLKTSGTKMKEHVPETASGFAGLFNKVMQDGALSVKEKELIALAIGVAQRCEPCIRIHTKKCLDAGATKEQILEAASVAVMMGGGPAYTHVPMVIETLEALQK